MVGIEELREQLWTKLAESVQLPGGVSFLAGFLTSLFAIICSELGDKTFIIAALLSMKHSHFVVFSGALSALALMSILSAVAGYILPTLLSPVYTHYAAVVLFFCFGVKLIYDGFRMEKDAGLEEIQEVEAELTKKDDALPSDEDFELIECQAVDTVTPVNSRHSSAHGVGLQRLAEVVGNATVGDGGGTDTKEDGEEEMAGKEEDTERSRTVIMRSKSDAEGKSGKAGSSTHYGTGKRKTCAKIFGQLFNPVFLQSFTLTFLAEWGDRSQIATIALAASKQAVGVVLGGILGHALCTGLAVMGGKMIATSISERTVTLFGGALFLFFAIAGLLWEV